MGDNSVQPETPQGERRVRLRYMGNWIHNRFHTMRVRDLKHLWVAVLLHNYDDTVMWGRGPDAKRDVDYTVHTRSPAHSCKHILPRFPFDMGKDPIVGVNEHWKHLVQVFTSDTAFISSYARLRTNRSDSFPGHHGIRGYQPKGARRLQVTYNIVHTISFKLAGALRVRLAVNRGCMSVFVWSMALQRGTWHRLGAVRVTVVCGAFKNLFE